MFEKCGLRDIFCKIARWKWLILAVMIVCAAAGFWMYRKDVQAYDVRAAEKAKEAETTTEREMFVGYAYYYVLPANEDASAENIRMLTDSYATMMGLNTTRSAIYDKLTAERTSEELAALLDPETFPVKVGRNRLWGYGYTVLNETPEPILRVRVRAVDKALCKEMLGVVREKLESLAESMPDSSLIYEGGMLRQETIGLDSSEKDIDENGIAKADGTDEEAGESMPSRSKILIWLIIGLVIGLLLAVISAVLRPVLNRASDFGGYQVTPVGEAGKKNIPLLARILDRQYRDGNIKKIAFVSSQKQNRKTEEFTRILCEEWKKLGRNIGIPGEEGAEVEAVLAFAPDRDAASSDRCQDAELVLALERKGSSTHKRFDEMLHYLEIMDMKTAGAVLIR